MEPSTRRPVYLAELSYPAVASLLPQQPIVLLPIGATEAHGPHLPLLTDVYLSDAWARRTQQALWQRGVDSVIAPALPYAVTEYGAAFSGTVSIDAETAGRLYAAVLQGLLRTGFSSLCVLNSHLEPAHIAALRKAVADLNQHAATKAVFADQTETRFARMLTDEYKREHREFVARRQKAGIAAPGEDPEVYFFVPDLNTPRRLERIAEALLARKHSEARVEKIIGANFVRLMRDVWGG